MSDDRIKAAELEVVRTRGRLLATLNELSQQFAPHRLIQDAWETAKDKGADLAEEAVDAVSRRPVATGAVVAAIVTFLARGSLMNAAGKITSSARSRRAKSRARRKSKVKSEESHA